MKEDAVGGLLDLGPRADAAGAAFAPEHVLRSRIYKVKVYSNFFGKSHVMCISRLWITLSRVAII